MKHFVTILLAMLTGFSLSAQNQPAPCGADQVEELMIDQNPDLQNKLAQTNSFLFAAANQKQTKSSAVVYQVPVVFHIIYNSEYDNISKAQVLDALRILNEDYRRLNADAVNTRAIFLGDAADVEVEFVLAGKDPSGNCTDGITRRKSFQSVNAYNNVKNIIQWDNTRYMNVWVVNSISIPGGSNSTLGYAYRPQAGGNPYTFDGIVIRHDAMGSIGTAANAGRLGRTLTHEVGHYLGLLHPFHFGCSQQGDGIADTPPVASANFGCNLNRNSCSETPDRPDQIENYMDYSDDNCTNMFSNGQRNVMRASLESSLLRRNLRLPGNLSLTGVTNPPVCTPTAALFTETQTLCPGDAVSFEGLSDGGTPSSWQWYFQGGQPSVSTDPSPVVSYGTAGSYDVSLVVTNSSGTDSIFYDDYIKVRPYWTTYEGQWVEDFEGSLNIPEVTVNSPEDNFGFEVTSLAAKTGSQSLYIDNFSANAHAPLGTSQGSGAIDEFISPHIFTIFSQGLTMTFDYALAAKQSTNTDGLRVLVSEDCGLTWNVARILQGGVLRTAPDLPSQPFVPTPSQWRTGIVPLSGYDNKGPILVKFEYKNGGGNNFYIDNINLTASNVDLEEIDLIHRLSIYPNPTSGRVTLDFGSETRSTAEVRIFDVYGKLVYSTDIAEGIRQYDISLTEMMPTGVYLLEVENAVSTYTERLVVK